MIITMGGEYGCGAKEIAKQAAELLGYKLCDDEIIIESVKDSGLDMEAETFAYYDESVGESSVGQIESTSMAQKQGALYLQNLAMDVLPLDRQLSQIQVRVLNQLADGDNCIILGRCASHYLRNRDNQVSIFVVDEEETRIRRVMEAHGLNEKEAFKLIKKTDKRRHDYHSFFTGEQWNDPKNYDFYLNCAQLGVEGTAKLIEALVRIKEQG